MENTQIIVKKLGAFAALYTAVNGNVTFTIVPAGKARAVEQKKLTLEGVKFNRPDPLVQVCVAGDPVNRQYSAGQTMRNAQSCFELKFDRQEELVKGDVTEIVTHLKRDDGQRAEHHLVYRAGRKYLTCYTVYANGSNQAVTLEMLSSFSLGSLTPFALDNPAGKLQLHRIRSQWSAEAQLETMPAEALLMEPSWLNYGVRGERFGQVGSIPARPFMPFIAVTDKTNNVTWAAALGCPSSWQLEYYLSQNSINISGGIADWEFGHWNKVLEPGQSITTPEAYLTAVQGDVDLASQYLTQIQMEFPAPECEKDLPVIYNEYCKTWGKPSHENVVPLVDACAALGINYFVMDAGWYEKADKGQSFYTPKKSFYPNGLEHTVQYINSKGMRAGLWYEFESRDYAELKGYYSAFGEDESAGGCILTRNGRAVRNMERAFVDMRSPKVVEILSRDVIGLLKEKGFGYLKTDYNENIGVGCDGAESTGENLRQHMLASQEFFRKIKREIPDLVLEICASGGMRHEPSMITLGDQVSYSDIHETEDGAVIAGDLHRVLQPKRSQIWATVRKSDDENRLVNTISKCFLGRMCFSGDIAELDQKQTAIVKSSIDSYNKWSHVIADGFSYFLGGKTKSLRFLEGYKGVLRVSGDGSAALLVLHTFDDMQGVLKLKHKALKGFKIEGAFKNSDVKIGQDGNTLTVTGMRKFSGAVVYLVK